MQNREMSDAVLQTIPGNVDSSSQPSPGAQPHSSPHPSQPGIGVEPATGLPVSALQAMRNPGPSLGGTEQPAWRQLLQLLKSPQSAQQQQQILAILKSNPQLMAAFMKQRATFQNQAQQKQHQGLQPTTEPSVDASQYMPNSGPTLGGMGRPTQTRQQFRQTLKSPSAQQQQQVLAILRSNPQLMTAAFIKQRAARQSQVQQQQSLQPTTVPHVQALQVMPNPDPFLDGMEQPAWQQLLQLLKFPPSAQQQQQILAILKSNPQIRAVFIQQRAAFQKQAQQQQQQQGLQATTEPSVDTSQVMSNPGPSLGGMQVTAEEWQQILHALESLTLL